MRVWWILFGLMGWICWGMPAPVQGTPPPKEARTDVSSPLRVVTTLPFLADFARVVGGERVQVVSLLSGQESGHTYTHRPSHLQALHEAQLLLEVGLGLEVWIKGLVRNADNPRLVVVTTSRGIPLLRGPQWEASGSMGNPHIWLDPFRAKEMIRGITQALVRLDPEGRDFYLRRQAQYFQQLDALVAEFVPAFRKWNHPRVVAHHPAWPYFAQRFGIQIVGVIQPQIGVEPSGAHLARLIRKMRQRQVSIIITEPQLNPKLPQTLARETGAALVTLTPLPGGIPGTETYLKMMRYNLKTLLFALKKATSP